MDNITKDYLGSVCELKSLNNDLLAVGKITEVSLDDITITFLDGTNLLLSPNIIIKLCVTFKGSSANVFMGRVFIGTKEKIKLTEVVTVNNFEKREFFRVNVYEEVRLYCEPIIYEDLFDPDKKYDIVRMNDLGLGGTLITSENFYESGKYVYIVMNLSIGQTIFETKILRQVDLKGNVGYACQFSDMPNRQSDALYRFIYQKQILDLRKNKI